MKLRVFCSPTTAKIVHQCQLGGLRSSQGTCLFTSDLTTRPKYTWWSCSQTGIHVRASYSLESVGRMRSGRRRGWEPATDLGNGNRQPLCMAGSPYHIISPYLLHKTFARNLRGLGRGNKISKFWVKWIKHQVSYGFASNSSGSALAQSKLFLKKPSVAKDKYPSVFYMVDGRLETILGVAKKDFKQISYLREFSRLHIQMIIIANISIYISFFHVWQHPLVAWNQVLFRKQHFGSHFFGIDSPKLCFILSQYWNDFDIRWCVFHLGSKLYFKYMLVVPIFG